MSDSEAPSVWVQWKGTELCADFQCTCGRRGHIDAEFCYFVRCGACGRCWELPTTLTLAAADGEDEPLVVVRMGDPQDADWDRK